MLVEKAKGQFKLEIEELKRKINILPSEKPFDFTEHFELQKEKNRKKRDSSRFLSLNFAEGNKIMYNQATVNNPMENVEKLKNGFCTTGYFILGDEREIETNSFFRDSSDLTNFRYKILKM